MSGKDCTTEYSPDYNFSSIEDALQSQVWWCPPLVPVFRKQRQVDLGVRD